MADNNFEKEFLNCKVNFLNHISFLNRKTNGAAIIIIVIHIISVITGAGLLYTLKCTANNSENE